MSNHIPSDKGPTLLYNQIRYGERTASEHEQLSPSNLIDAFRHMEMDEQAFFCQRMKDVERKDWNGADVILGQRLCRILSERISRICEGLVSQ